MQENYHDEAETMAFVITAFCTLSVECKVVS